MKSQRLTRRQNRIQDVFKIFTLPIDREHGDNKIELIRFSPREDVLVVMSDNYKVSLWKVGSWNVMSFFRAHHISDLYYKWQLQKDSNIHFYEEKIKEDFDISEMQLSADCNWLVLGTYSG